MDEWLRVNATCPTCRKSIRGEPDPPATSASVARSTTDGTRGGSTTISQGGSISSNVVSNPTRNPLSSDSRREDGVFNYEVL